MPLRCFRRRYWKYCTKGMRTVLYNMLGCESFISRSFRPFPRGGEQKIMIVSGVLNSGCERSGGLIRETGRKRLSYGPTIFAKKLQKSREIYNFTAFLQLFCKNSGPAAQPFPCLFKKMIPNNSQALSAFPFRTSLIARSCIIGKQKNKRSSQKRLIRIQAECT